MLQAWWKSAILFSERAAVAKDFYADPVYVLATYVLARLIQWETFSFLFINNYSVIIATSQGHVR